MDDEKVIHHTNNIEENLHGRPLISFIRKVCDAREDVILVHETRNRFGTTDTSHNTILQIKVIRQYDVVGISSYLICFTLWCIKYDNSGYPYRPFTDYIRNIPYMPKSILEQIEEIQLKDSDIGHFGPPNEYGRRPIIWNDMCHYLDTIKQTIEDNLNEDAMVSQLKEVDIVNEINDLRSENKELHHKISMLQTLIKDKDEKTKNDIQQLQHELKSVRITIIDMLKTKQLQEIDIFKKHN
uniref:Uncharacterized protein n=1 Tax=viral metagenome TaxID=1070528 RepID=A0A6C0BAQ7_9ZZZZ